MKRYELIDHPADAGIRCQASLFPQLLEDLACGLFDLITDYDQILKEEPKKELDIRIHGETAEDTVHAWLRELLYLFSSRGFIPLRFAFQHADEKGIQGRLSGIRYDAGRHVQRSEVKAVTRHGFYVGRQAGQWTAEVIFDL